jgi:DNA polymerase I-like protein with 3'-5' exonuclease and polymerase domains
MVPEDGELWCSADFSGQEPRWIVDYAVKTNCPGADEILAAYLENPKLDLHQKTADLAGIKRKDAKTIFLGLAYGMGGMKLCKSLGYPSLKEENLKAWKERIARDRYEQEQNPSKFSHVKNWETYDYPGTKGRELVERFNAMVPFLKALQRKASAAADKNLMVRTIKGRPCKFDKVPSHGRMGPGFAALHGHKALNRIVQGSSADETKLALINAERAGLRPTLQVHDEIDASVPSAREAEALAEIMKTAIPKQVPTLVDIELGSSWGDSMKEAAESRKLSGINW